MAQLQVWKSGIVKKLAYGVQGLVKGSGTQYVGWGIAPPRVGRRPQKADAMDGVSWPMAAAGSGPPLAAVGSLEAVDEVHQVADDDVVALIDDRDLADRVNPGRVAVLGG